MTNLPKARTADILEQEAGRELMIYDLRIDKAYNLNETLTIIYKACNGKTSFNEVNRAFKFTDDLIYLALDKLHRENLLTNYESCKFKNLSRREIIKKIGLVSMIALPVITGLVAPPAAAAQSGSAQNFANCVPLGVCQTPNGYICRTGCVATISVAGSGDQSCGILSAPYPVNCNGTQSLFSPGPFQRVA